MAQMARMLEESEERHRREMDQREARHRVELNTQLASQRAQLEALLSSDAANNALALRRRRAEQSWQNSDLARAERINAYVNQGFTPAQAEVFVNEPPESSMHVTPATRRREWQAKDIATFDGQPEHLDTFINRVQMLYEAKTDPNWREPLIEALPVCLTGSASEWLESQPLEWKVEHLATLEGWITELREVFGGDASTKQTLAYQRTWNYTKESGRAYFFSKQKVMSSAFPLRSKDDFVVDIVNGMPATFQIHCREQFQKHPSADALLREIQSIEGPWRLSAEGRELVGSTADTSTTTTVKTENQAVVVKSQPTSKTQKDSLKRSFKPENLYSKGGVDYYERPDNKMTIKRDRPCTICQGPHFDFAHDHFAVVKKEVYIVTDRDTFGGYPVVASGSESSSDRSGSLSPSVSASSSTDSTKSAGSSPSTAIQLDTSPSVASN